MAAGQHRPTANRLICKAPLALAIWHSFAVTGPTSASWLNAVEGFFAKLTRKRLCRGSFRSIVDLQAAIHRFIAEHNKNAKRFVWTADPDRIIKNANKAKGASDLPR